MAKNDLITRALLARTVFTEYEKECRYFNKKNKVISRFNSKGVSKIDKIIRTHHSKDRKRRGGSLRPFFEMSFKSAGYKFPKTS